MSTLWRKRFRVDSGPNTAHRFCRCKHQYYGHRSRGGSCYACECNSFTQGVTPTHRWAVAPRKTTIYGGHKYDSIAEANYARQLDWRKTSGDIKDWEPHPVLDLRFNGFHVGFYKIDFAVYHLDGRTEYVEVKGYIAITPLWKWKWTLAKALFNENPKVFLTLVAA